MPSKQEETIRNEDPDLKKNREIQKEVRKRADPEMRSMINSLIEHFEVKKL